MDGAPSDDENIPVNRSLTNHEKRLWGDNPVRAFICHTHTQKKTAKEVKAYLDKKGVSSFVAHEDIEPMKEWESEIHAALLTMDFLVALLSSDFSDSNWTDQEVGVAVGREVPIVPVRMGKDPYGFIGKYQAITASANSYQIADGIFRYLLEEFDNKGKATDALIVAISKSESFDEANRLAERLPELKALTSHQADLFVQAFNTNNQVRGSFGFNGTRPDTHGPGLAHYLQEITGDRYYFQESDGALIVDSLPF